MKVCESCGQPSTAIYYPDIDLDEDAHYVCDDHGKQAERKGFVVYYGLRRKMTVFFDSEILSELAEEIEDALAESLETLGLKGRIEDVITGNTTTFGSDSKFYVT